MEIATFEQIALAAWPGLVRWCAWLIGSRDEAEDLAQEALSIAWRSTKRPAHTEEYSAWMAGIARNLCRSWKRDHQRELLHRVQFLQTDESSDNDRVSEADDL